MGEGEGHWQGAKLRLRGEKGAEVKGQGEEVKPRDPGMVGRS